MVFIYVLGKALFLSKTHEGEHFFCVTTRAAGPRPRPRTLIFFYFRP